MGLYDRPSTELVWLQINRDNPHLPKPLSANNVVLLQGPLTTNLGSTGRNTRAIFNGIPGAGYAGKVVVFYDRLNLAYLFKNFVPSIRIPYRATTRAQILPALNAALGLQLTATDIGNPDVSIGSSLITSGTVGISVAATCMAFTGAFNVTWTREDPELTDIWLPENDTKVGIWKNFGFAGTVWRKSWHPWYTALQQVPANRPLQSNQTGVANFVTVLRNWTGLPFECNLTIGEGDYDLTMATAQLLSTLNVPDANQNYKNVLVVTPVPGRHKWTQPLYLHYNPRDTTEVVTATYEDFRRYIEVNKLAPAPKGALAYSYLNKVTLIDMATVSGNDVMYGTPWGGNAADSLSSALTRMAQHSFPTLAAYNATVNQKLLVLASVMGNIAVSSYPATNRNGYSSGPRGGSSNGTSFNKFVYFDPDTGVMKSNVPFNASAPVNWLP